MAGSLIDGAPVSSRPANRRRYWGAIGEVIETSYQPPVGASVHDQAAWLGGDGALANVASVSP